MPRTNRNTVEFTANGTLWRAEFVHFHNEDVGVPYTPDPTKRTVWVKHVTVCRLSQPLSANPGITLRGESPCSMKDAYNWRKGLRRALQKALEKGHYCKFTMDANRREKVIKLKDEYTEILTAFFTELPKKAYWPHDGSQKPVEPNKTPVENRAGLAYTGMD
jgi:hypothetical protein